MLAPQKPVHITFQVIQEKSKPSNPWIKAKAVLGHVSGGLAVWLKVNIEIFFFIYLKE